MKDFGTFSSFSQELDDYDEEEVVVGRVEKWGEPSGFKGLKRTDTL